MPKITLTCELCGARLVTDDVTELGPWDREHDKKCIARKEVAR